MTIDRFLLICVSGLSLLLSAWALFVTYRQKAHQDRLLARKTLSDLISAITDTNIEMAKLRTTSPTEEVMQLRRALNSRRRNLSHHAELLTSEIPDLCTDADHMLLAGALDASGNVERAEYHWAKAVEIAPAPITKCYDLRGYARFLISNGRAQAARKAFENALEAASDDNDRHRRERADTLVMWALAEQDLGFDVEANRLREQALAEAARIGAAASREDMIHYINGHLRRQHLDAAPCSSG